MMHFICSAGASCLLSKHSTAELSLSPMMFHFLFENPEDSDKATEVIKRL